MSLLSPSSFKLFITRLSTVFINSNASVALSILGAKPPSSPTPHSQFLSFNTVFNVLNTSDPILRFSLYSEVLGIIINS